MAYEFGFNMATFFYTQHYKDKISPNLTEKQKKDLASRISELTLASAIWEDREKDYVNDFPELKPLINTKLSGLYLCSIFDGIVGELTGKKTFSEKAVGPLFTRPLR